MKSIVDTPGVWEEDKMVDRAQAAELVASLVRHGETLDPEDMSVLFGWIYSASVALQPFPSEHRIFCRRCRDSFDNPRERLSAGLAALREALKTAEQECTIREESLSEDYYKLLRKVFS